MTPLEDIIYRHERGTTPRKEDITFLLARAEQAERERDEAEVRLGTLAATTAALAEGFEIIDAALAAAGVPDRKAAGE